MKIDLRLELSFSPRWAFWALTALVLAAATSRLASEDLTLSTYYPSPLGVYKQLVTTGSGSVNTLLARDAGKVGIGTASPGSYKLEVVGTSRFEGDVTVQGAGSFSGDLTAAGNAVFGPSGARSAWFQTDGQAYIASRLGIGTSPPSSGWSVYGAGNAQFDGYITNLCTSVGYGTGGWQACPGSMTLLSIENTYGNAEYHVGTGTGDKYSTFPAAGTMICCRFW